MLLRGILCLANHSENHTARKSCFSSNQKFPLSQFEFGDIAHCRLEEAWLGCYIYMQKEIGLKAIT